MHEFRNRYGIIINHHEFAATLDYMERIGQASHHKHNYGDTQYFIEIKPVVG
jgi:hypothetical protein